MLQKSVISLSMALLAMAGTASGQMAYDDGSVGRAMVISGGFSPSPERQAGLTGYSTPQSVQQASAQAQEQQAQAQQAQKQQAQQQQAQSQAKEQSAEPKPAPVVECENGECGECVPCQRTCRKIRLNIFVDWLYLQARGADLGFSYPTDEAFGRPLGPTNQLDYDYEADGIRYGLGMRLACSPFQVQFTGTHFNTGTNAAGWPDPELTLQTLLLNSPDPLSADAASSTFALARGIIEFDTYDLDLVRTVYRDQCSHWAGWVGVRVAAMDQSLRVIYDGDTVRSGQDLRGAGVRAGLGGTRQFGLVKVFGRLTGSLLAADMDVDYQQTNVLDGVVVDYSQDIDRVLPVVDLEVGIGIQPTRCLGISVGYMYSMWFNVVTAPELIQALQNNDFTGDVRDDLTFDGLFTRVELKW